MKKLSILNTYEKIVDTYEKIVYTCEKIELSKALKYYTLISTYAFSVLYRHFYTESQHLHIFRIKIVKFFKVFVECLKVFVNFFKVFVKFFKAFVKFFKAFVKLFEDSCDFLKNYGQFFQKKVVNFFNQQFKFSL